MKKLFFAAFGILFNLKRDGMSCHQFFLLCIPQFYRRLDRVKQIHTNRLCLIGFSSCLLVLERYHYKFLFSYYCWLLELELVCFRLTSAHLAFVSEPLRPACQHTHTTDYHQTIRFEHQTVAETVSETKITLESKRRIIPGYQTMAKARGSAEPRRSSRIKGLVRLSSFHLFP